MTAVAAVPAFAPAPSILRLFTIELRKTVDTRAGFWLLASSALVTVAVAVITLLSGDARDQMFSVFFSRTVGTAGVLIPVVGILAVTSEWSQRTALTTFALVPNRERVIAAKLLAGLALAIASVAVCLVTSAAATTLVPLLGHGDGAWDLAVAGLGTAVLFMAMWTAAGAALGLVLMSSAPAIVLSFLIPLGTAGLATIPGADGAMRWIDLGTASAELNATQHAVSAQDWGHLAAGVAVWVIVPLALGFLRLRRREVTSS
jgi:ABC-2 type transport system permease protein